MATDMTKIVVTVREMLSVSNIPIVDETRKRCLSKANALSYEVVEEGETKVEYTTFDTDSELLSEKQRDLSLAWLYAEVAGYSAQSGTITDKDADWEHSEGSFRITDKLRDLYKKLADELFAKWDEPTLFSDDWGFVGRGIRNPRKYR